MLLRIDRRCEETVNAVGGATKHFLEEFL